MALNTLKRRDTFLDRINPIANLTLRDARAIFDAARRCGSPLLQRIYDEIELADPVLMTCVERRASALSALSWSVKKRASADQVLADEQLDALDFFDWDRSRAWYMDIAHSDRDFIYAISKRNCRVFKKFITRGDATYTRGREKYEELAFQYWCLSL